MGRIYLIGIDGLSYGMAEHLTGHDVMPHLTSLLEEGTFAKMESSIPEVSSVAWTSIITGTNPGSHNVFGFTDIIDGSCALGYTSSRTIKADPFWKKDDNARNLIMNVPQTYPALPMNGVMVAGYVALDIEKAVYPPKKVSFFQENGYRIDVEMSVANSSKDRFYDELNRVMQTRANVLEKLLAEENWDRIMFVITGSDRLNHYFWTDYEDTSSPYHQRFLDFYSEIDTIISRITQSLKKEDTLVLVSDHGFERQDMSVNLNTLLREAGYLKLRNDERINFSSMLPETRAFAMDPGRIYLYRKQRYPGGSVTDDEASELIEELKTFFLQAEVNGKRIVGKVFCRQDIYSGPMIHRAPDLVCMPEENIALSARIQSKELIEETVLTGKHSFPDAVFYCRTRKTLSLPDKMRVEDVIPVLENCGVII